MRQLCGMAFWCQCPALPNRIIALIECISLSIVSNMRLFVAYVQCACILWYRWVCFYGNECAVSEFTPTRSLSASDYIVHACTPTQSHCQHHFILLIMMRGEKVCSFQDFTWNDFLFCAGNTNSQIKEQYFVYQVAVESSVNSFWMHSYLVVNNLPSFERNIKNNTFEKKNRLTWSFYCVVLLERLMLHQKQTSFQNGFYHRLNLI